jgi:SAM-dependent methyltransferase
MDMGQSSSTLASIARSTPGADIGTKPEEIWNIYERYLAPLRSTPLRILELGIHKGVSVRTFATYFHAGLVVGLDIMVPVIDPLPNLVMKECNQVDVDRLEAISAEHAPDGWDIIIDDASHAGHHSLVSFNALFANLKPGGFYFVEDWGIAYSTVWGDSAAPQPPELYDPHPVAGFKRRIRTHDYGMAGFVKALVDRAYYPDSIFEWLNIHPSTVVVKKL